MQLNQNVMQSVRPPKKYGEKEEKRDSWLTVNCLFCEELKAGTLLGQEAEQNQLLHKDPQDVPLTRLQQCLCTNTEKYFILTIIKVF